MNELWTLSATELSQLEKSIGSAVAKARSYYETRIKLRDAKDILTKAKHRFERAQALHVAAKELALISVGNNSIEIFDFEKFIYRLNILMKQKNRIKMLQHGMKHIDMQ